MEPVKKLGVRKVADVVREHVARDTLGLIHDGDDGQPDGTGTAPEMTRLLASWTRVSASGRFGRREVQGSGWGP